MGLLNGLKLSTEMLLEEGLENVFARHHRIAEGVRRAVAAWGMDLCAVRPALYSDTVSAIRTPAGFDANRVVARALDSYGVSFGTGLGEVAGKVFRIGHLGDLNEPMLLGALTAVEMALRINNVPHGRGGVEAAMDFLVDQAEAAG